MTSIDPNRDRSDDPTPIEPSGLWSHKTMSTNGFARCLNLGELFAASERRMPQVVACYWPNVLVAGPDDCWIWIGRTTKKGYGQLRFELQGQVVRLAAHRFSFAMARPDGVVPSKALVRHSCGVRSCVNPRHLYLGDYHAKPYEAKGAA
jgi:hypothetical protein